MLGQSVAVPNTVVVLHRWPHKVFSGDSFEQVDELSYRDLVDPEFLRALRPDVDDARRESPWSVGAAVGGQPLPRQVRE